MLKIVEVDDASEIVENIVGKGMSWWHAYYARACVEEGICRALIAREDGVDIGIGLFYTVKDLGIGIVYYVVVDEGFRGMGIGKALVLSIEELLGSEGIDIFLATTTEDNIVSIKMFESLGYRVLYFYEFDRRSRYSISDRVVRLTCGFEDDVLLIKCVEGDCVEELVSRLSRSRARKVVEHIWFRICYSPWRRLHGF